MINFLWAGMFLAAIAAALWNLAVYQDSGSFSLLTEAIFQNARNAVEICIGLAGILSFWLGMLKLIEEAGIAEKISRKLTPLFKVLMKDIPENSPAISTVVLNMAANFLGLDNAAKSAKRYGKRCANPVYDIKCLFGYSNSYHDFYVPGTNGSQPPDRGFHSDFAGNISFNSGWISAYGNSAENRPSQ